MKRVLIFILLLGFGGCIASHQSVVVDIDARKWVDTKYVVMNNNDTSTLRDIELFVRYSPLMADDSVTLTINTIAPDSTTYSEEVKLHFDTSPSERSASRLKLYPYRKRVVWRQVGSYQIEITPITPVKGIESIGVNTVKNQS